MKIFTKAFWLRRKQPSQAAAPPPAPTPPAVPQKNEPPSMSTTIESPPAPAAATKSPGHPSAISKRPLSGLDRAAAALQKRIDSKAPDPSQAAEKARAEAATKLTKMAEAYAAIPTEPGRLEYWQKHREEIRNLVKIEHVRGQRWFNCFVQHSSR
jgi:hypothetical protein